MAPDATVTDEIELGSLEAYCNIDLRYAAARAQRKIKLSRHRTSDNLSQVDHSRAYA